MKKSLEDKALDVWSQGLAMINSPNYSKAYARLIISVISFAAFLRIIEGNID